MAPEARRKDQDKVNQPPGVASSEKWQAGGGSHWLYFSEENWLLFHRPSKEEVMRIVVALILGLMFCSGPAVAGSAGDGNREQPKSETASNEALPDTPKDGDPQSAQNPKTKTSKKAAKPAKSATAILAEQVEALRQSMEAQQQQIKQLQEELAKRDSQIGDAKSAAAAADAKASEADAKASAAASSTADVKTTTTTLSSDVADLKLGNDSLKGAVQDTQKKIIAAESPTTIHYKGVNITPGGFLAAETVYRQRAESADINTQFNGIPFSGNSLSRVSENVFSARQSRATLLAESKVGSAKLTGYYEADFLGAGTTSNNRQSNSYVFRQRQVWGQVAFDNGFSVTGGQMWSLAVETRKGIQNRQEALPMIIDPQYVVGFTWQRAYGVRLVKSFADKFSLAFAIEGPQTTIGGRGFSTFTNAAGATSQNFWVNAPGLSAGLNNAFDPTGYTPNKAPDLIFKAALDPRWGHYEIFAILSQFRARIYPCAVVSATPAGVVTAANGTTTTFTGDPITCAVDPTATAPTAAGAFNDSRTGGGGGASFRVPLFTKKVEFGLKGVYGDGINRFGSAQLADVTARADGTLAPIRGGHGLGILEFHPTPKLDIYAYGGAEYAARAAYHDYETVKITTVAISNPNGVAGAPTRVNTTVARASNGIGGYGSPFANNSGCSTENPPTNQLTPSAGGTCAGDSRVVIEGTLGFWHKIYQGPKGGIRWGVQYSYLTRSGWSGNNNVPTAVGVQPKAVDNMLFTSLRYYLP